MTALDANDRLRNRRRTLVDLLAAAVDARAELDHRLRVFEREAGQDIDNLRALVDVIEPPADEDDLDWLLENARCFSAPDEEEWEVET